jgi:hypothetical protein
MKTLRFHVLTLMVGFLALSSVANAASLTLAWDASSDPAVYGYRLYWGTQPGQYTSSLDVRTSTSVTVPNLIDGRAYYFVVRAYTSMNTESAPSVEVSRRVGVPFMVRNDFDADQATDMVVYRKGTGEWFVLPSGTDFNPARAWATYQWGSSTDIPLKADFDGDGKSDLALYRPSDGGWYIRYSSRGYALNQWGYFQWGLPTDIPIAADFDGDAKTY